VPGLTSVLRPNNLAAGFTVGLPDCHNRLGGYIRLITQENHRGIGLIGESIETCFQRGALPYGELRIDDDPRGGRKPQYLLNFACRVSQHHHHFIEPRFPEDVYDMLEQGLSPIGKELFETSHSG
jgi:hypothetical protein